MYIIMTTGVFLTKRKQKRFFKMHDEFIMFMKDNQKDTQKEKNPKF